MTKKITLTADQSVVLAEKTVAVVSEVSDKGITLAAGAAVVSLPGNDLQLKLGDKVTIAAGTISKLVEAAATKRHNPSNDVLREAGLL